MSFAYATSATATSATLATATSAIATSATLAKTSPLVKFIHGDDHTKSDIDEIRHSHSIINIIMQFASECEQCDISNWLRGIKKSETNEIINRDEVIGLKFLSTFKDKLYYFKAMIYQKGYCVIPCYVKIHSIDKMTYGLYFATECGVPFGIYIMRNYIYDRSDKSIDVLEELYHQMEKGIHIEELIKISSDTCLSYNNDNKYRFVNLKFKSSLNIELHDEVKRRKFQNGFTEVPTYEYPELFNLLAQYAPMYYKNGNVYINKHHILDNDIWIFKEILQFELFEKSGYYYIPVHYSGMKRDYRGILYCYNIKDSCHHMIMKINKNELLEKIEKIKSTEFLANIEKLKSINFLTEYIDRKIAESSANIDQLKIIKFLINDQTFKNTDLFSIITDIIYSELNEANVKVESYDIKSPKCTLGKFNIHDDFHRLNIPELQLDDETKFTKKEGTYDILNNIFSYNDIIAKINIKKCKAICDEKEKIRNIFTSINNIKYVYKLIDEDYDKFKSFHFFENVNIVVLNDYNKEILKDLMNCDSNILKWTEEVINININNLKDRIMGYYKIFSSINKNIQIKAKEYDLFLIRKKNCITYTKSEYESPEKCNDLQQSYYKILFRYLKSEFALIMLLRIMTMNEKKLLKFKNKENEIEFEYVLDILFGDNYLNRFGGSYNCWLEMIV